MLFTPGSQRKFCFAETCSSFQGSCMNLHRKYKLAQRINSLNLESSLVRIPVQGYLIQRCYSVSTEHFPVLSFWFT